MQEFDPFSVSEDLRKAFIRYLREAHAIHESESDLRKHFDDALRAEDRFVREPLVSCIPSYRHAQTPAELLGRKSPPRLHPALKGLDPEEFDPSRPLYVHQIQAMERIQAGHNVVVATGTGSGKTECFLLPILDHAIQCREPGTTAIIIYPMNALANDQLDRMRRLIGSTPITFGRYTSQTYYTDDQVPESVKLEAKRPNEKLTRTEIRESPPQILLTNFAMLEYLLLRPQDQLIFRYPTVRYIVLDEAHTYSGAQGIDISLLMRRVQRQYPHQLQFILTSATLGDQDHSHVRDEIANFASRLCGSGFTPQDVIFGEVDEPFERPGSQPCTSETIVRLAANSDVATVHQATQSTSAVQAWLRGCGLKPQAGKTPNDILYNTLRQVDAAIAAYDQLRCEPRTVSELAHSIFRVGESQAAPTEQQRQAAVRALLVAASLASPDIQHRSPLMSVRVHHFFRGLSGLSVSLEPSKPPKVRRVVLEDCVTDDQTGLRLLLLKTCTHCGMPVVVVRLPSGNKWEKPVGISRSPIRLLTWFDLSALESESGEADEVETTASHDAQLCLRCGAIPKSCGRPRQVKRRFVLRRRTRCRRSGPAISRSRSTFSSVTRPCGPV
ncbi:DEAD/DEAH box helicase [Fontivita pretiosa]|uniref:DEAD/DEAH box helicase n=1 Tax=Fontivita pretiosa TaxID=2989684 RepID=UPI003D181BC8